MLARFSDFVRFIDDQGGIGVPVSNPMPADCADILPGTLQMDGAAALCYLRERDRESVMTDLTLEDLFTI